MISFIRKLSRVLCLGAVAIMVAAPQPSFAKGKKGQKTTREFVTSANSMEIKTTRKRVTYNSLGKPVSVAEDRTYEVNTLTRVEIDGKVSEASMILPGMTVSVVADRKQSMDADDKGVLIARMVTATTKAKPPGSK